MGLPCRIPRPLPSPLLPAVLFFDKNCVQLVKVRQYMYTNKISLRFTNKEWCDR